MTIVSRNFAKALGAVAMAVLLSSPAPAQAPAAAAGGPIPIDRIKVTGSMVRSPEVQAKSYTSINPKKVEWYQIDCLYETKPEWMDEITVTYFALMRTGDQREPFVLLKGETTFVHLMKGVHRAQAYVHPALLRRFGKVEGCAVELRSQGRPLKADSTDPQYRKWIEQLSPKDGHILQPKDTPFAHLDYDAFEMEKPRQAQ
ncbi:MAG: hypothetical protein FJ221_13160 [Lentisphaerae bacterium]|nr:hypothetical protein [Lentisphaerota bacterium]